jgi:hypothetical protein
MTKLDNVHFTVTFQRLPVLGAALSTFHVLTHLLLLLKTQIKMKLSDN